MQGFFSKKETQSISAVGGKIHSCTSCGLYANCKSAKMQPRGKFDKGILILGEAPSEIDDNRGKHWQDKAGKLLENELEKLGIDMYQDCLFVNAINCYPGDRSPTNLEVDHCRSVIVWKVLQEYQPKVILALGDAAMQSITGHRISGGIPVNLARGYQIPDQELKAWVIPAWHPKYLLKVDKAQDMMKIWREDLERAVKALDQKFLLYRKPEIEIVKDLSFLKGYPTRLSAFDYETTGIKPHMKGHRIVSCAIADSPDHVYAFMMPKTKEGRLPLRKWLYNKEIPKVAQNMKFEDTWSKVRLKVDVRGWEFDTMLASHILDNRPGTSGLKFQAYVKLGEVDYNEEVKDYFTSNDTEHGDNAINRIMELASTSRGREKLLTYNAMDSIFEYRLALIQMEELNYDFLPF